MRSRTRDGEPMVLAVLPSLLDKLADAGLRSVALPECFVTKGPACQRAAIDGSALS